MEESFSEICFEFFKDCLPQILLGPFLNTLSHTTPGEFSTILILLIQTVVVAFNPFHATDLFGTPENIRKPPVF